MTAAKVNAVLDGNYSALTNNGATVASPDDIFSVTNATRTNTYTHRSWIAERRTYLTNELAKVAPPFTITNNNGNDFTTGAPSLLLGGQAPVEVASIQAKRIVGTNTLVLTMGLTHWASVTNWTVLVPLTNGANRLEVTGLDRLGVANAFDSITVTNQ